MLRLAAQTMRFVVESLAEMSQRIRGAYKTGYAIAPAATGIGERGAGVRVTTRMLHNLQLPELTGLVLEYEDGRVEKIGEVPDDWQTNERLFNWG